MAQKTQPVVGLTGLPVVPELRQRKAGFMDNTNDMTQVIDELAQLAGTTRVELGRSVIFVGLNEVAARYGMTLVAGDGRYELAPIVKQDS